MFSLRILKLCDLCRLILIKKRYSNPKEAYKNISGFRLFFQYFIKSKEIDPFISIYCQILRVFDHYSINTKWAISE